MPFVTALTLPRHRLAAPALLLVLAAPLAATGCSSRPAATPAPVAARDLAQEADDALARAVRAAREGRLEQAQKHTANAQRLAQTTTQKQQAQSLEQLIAGAQAMLNGDARSAGQAWAQITDPTLKKEVHLLADRIGIDVPVVTATPQES